MEVRLHLAMRRLCSRLARQIPQMRSATRQMGDQDEADSLGRFPSGWQRWLRLGFRRKEWYRIGNWDPCPFPRWVQEIHPDARRIWTLCRMQTVPKLSEAPVLFPRIWESGPHRFRPPLRL